MEKAAIDSKIKSVMARVFGIAEDQITENASQDTIEKWDSLGHLNFVVALEEEFGIVLSDEQVIELLNYKLVFQTVNELVGEGRG